MNNWFQTNNCTGISLKSIPLLTLTELRKEIVDQCTDNNKRLVSFFGTKREKGIILYVILAHDETSTLYITSADYDKSKQCTSITKSVPSFHIFERELFEEFGITPEEHPWLKPVRYAGNRCDKDLTIENFPFFTMTGDEVHEVAVGPVHAGIIEPGHFRFMCHGEKIYHLEIQLGYQHRGIEALIIKESPSSMVHLAESIAGDSVIAHGSAYAHALETLSRTTISKRAMIIRSIALELERIAMHIGDLGAIANDVAYLIGSAFYGARRTLVINTTQAICGNRLGRGLVRTGGVTSDIDGFLASQIRSTLATIYEDITFMSEKMFAAPSVLSRLEQTGIVLPKQAKKIGLTGMAARASGIAIDTRTDHPSGAYRNHPVNKMVLTGGDVFARTYIRYLEVLKSIELINELLDSMQDESVFKVPGQQLEPESMVISMTEGWRGEVTHIALTDTKGDIIRYKIKDPSFNNWIGLALSVRNNGISDFPLCNKSFNLSYCGNDL
ncbi:MAG: hydrogenase [Candidatus Margulisiibacteriota bacterium]|nr:MAG: hypothetical protein A2X43_07360 [Candidatus Margulisbacteria bacterium GWD2_39_127]OGI01966.1 MAG: hypothetical protein A2X42_09815 [Candidatus Margulisbacteria bacterium GWF2_38_17]PZM77280.1 MAG: hydrogenase [Candidatus Margulisiibacteriota bacterium]HAR62919.1 hydrogenase [Candidatus Margulisiibacteriota bacterium]HCT85926.1 hydrogenase [Candidatus Margulisiibacteriota bacterium]